jgi:hypothetical protein
VIERLEPLVGTWEISVPGAPFTGRAVFEWALGGRFLIQRTEIDWPEAPDTFAIISANASGDGYTQHYFDSRGVVRLYAMAFADRTWTLSRERPDFTPLSFSQRFSATLDEDGAAMRGAWEKTAGPDGAAWEVDFPLEYRRAGA